jgi:hypothetical protein
MGRRDFENPVNQRDFKTPMKPMNPEDRKRSPSPSDRGSPGRDEPEKIKSSSGPTLYWSQYRKEEKEQNPRISEPFVADKSDKERSDFLSVQALQNIKLASLELEAVEKWWKLVEQYEKNHGPWDRRRIDTSVRDKIDRRWMDDSLWEHCLPAQIQEAKKGG